MSDEFPEPTDGLYFAGMDLHASVLHERKRHGRKAALALIRRHRQVALMYADGAPGFALREGQTLDSLTRGARPAALLRLALLDKLEALIRKARSSEA